MYSGSFIIFFGLLGIFQLSTVDAKLEHLEVLNVKSWKVNEELTKNYEAKLKASVPIAKGSLAATFSMFADCKTIKEPQDDLNELAQMYETLNTADIFTLNFLRNHCQEKGLLQATSDPILCQQYTEFLAKQIQNRMDVIISRVFLSRGILQSPPRWLYHVITAGTLMKNLDAKNQMNYEVKESITKILAPTDSEEFEKNPNILNDPSSISTMNLNTDTTPLQSIPIADQNINSNLTPASEQQLID